MQTSSPETILFGTTLKEHGLRSTQARQSVFTVLLEAAQPLTIQEIVERSPNGHMVSVYRTIDMLLKIGVINTVPQGFKNTYELSDIFTPHHHHATCETCGTSVSIHSNHLEELMKELTIDAGFSPTKHHFEMHGVCSACQSSVASES